MGVIFNTRVVWGVAVVVLVVSLSSAGIIFNTRVARGAVVSESLS